MSILETIQQIQNKKPLILIGDDDRFSRKIISDSFKTEEYTLIEAKDGEEVIALFKRFSPDIILLDVIMPKKDGYETCSEIRALPEGKKTPILMITSLDKNYSIEKAFDSGADDYITKPINNLTLQKRVARLLQSEQYRKSQEMFASYDFLTGALNRRAFSEKIIEECYRSQRTKQTIGIILSDIDKFKKVNDNYGHLIGDFVLKEFTKRIRNNCREYDFIGRYGGDEFIVCLPNTNIQQSLIVAQRIREAILKQDFIYQDCNIPITGSFGVNALENFNSILEKKDSDHIIKEILEKTDVSLYDAKKNGRNQIKFPERIENNG